MNPSVALVAASILVAAVLFIDGKRPQNVSLALWLPTIWVGILASRPVAGWFTFDFDLLAQAGESPIDRNILIVLMALGIAVLIKRKLPWLEWIKANPWIVVFFLYCGISILWSDFPGIGFKRWARGLGALLMMLVVLSEDDPIAAIRAVFRRCGYVLVPMSIIVIKYFPAVGVGYNVWIGTAQLAGVTTDKNALGRLCLVAGLFIVWDLMVTRQRKDLETNSSIHQLIGVAMLGLTVWLLFQSHSSTSLAAFVLGCSILFVTGSSVVRKRARFLGSILLFLVAMAIGLDQLFDLREVIVESLGRDMTLTDRTFIWHDLLALPINPFFGVGYDTFWLGDRLAWFARQHQVAEAHSGYIEAYLEVGAIGCLLLLGVLASAFARARNHLADAATASYGRLQLALLAVFIAYNVTESAYKITILMAFTLLLSVMQRPGIEQPADRNTTLERGRRKPVSSMAPKSPAQGPARGVSNTRVQRGDFVRTQ